jgi:hypothetical protein
VTARFQSQVLRDFALLQGGSPAMREDLRIIVHPTIFFLILIAMSKSKFKIDFTYEKKFS